MQAVCQLGVSGKWHDAFAHTFLFIELSAHMQLQSEVLVRRNVFGGANRIRRSLVLTLGKGVKAARLPQTDIIARRHCAMRRTSSFYILSSEQRRRAPQRKNLSRFACERIRSRSDARFLGCEGEIAKIGSLLRGAFRPED